MAHWTTRQACLMNSVVIRDPISKKLEDISEHDGCPLASTYMNIRVYTYAASHTSTNMYAHF